MLCPSKMLESHDVTVHLFNNVVNAREEMLTSLMIAGELLGESDEALVVDIERSRVKLFEPELLQYRPKVDYVLSCFDGSVGFCFCRTEGDDGLLTTSRTEGASVIAEGEADSSVGLGVLVRQVGCIAPCMQASDCFALAGTLGVVHEFQMSSCLEVGSNAL